MKPTKNIRKTLRYRLEYLAFMICKFLILRLPQPARFRLAEKLGLLAYRLLRMRRRIALANLRLAFPEKSGDEREAIAKASYSVMARAFLCSLWFREYVETPGQVRIVGGDEADAVYARGKGVIGATMHTGILDLACWLYHGKPLAAVAKNQRNPHINEFITESRKEGLGITVIPKTKHTTRDLIRCIKEGYIIGLLSDHRDKGAKVRFFGVETVAPTGAVSLALKYEVPLIFVYTLLHPDNRCDIVMAGEVELVRTGNFKEDVLANTQALITRMEDVIRRHPEQWMWFHDRWSLRKTL